MCIVASRSATTATKSTAMAAHRSVVSSAAATGGSTRAKVATTATLKPGMVAMPSAVLRSAVMAGWMLERLVMMVTGWRQTPALAAV